MIDPEFENLVRKHLKKKVEGQPINDISGDVSQIAQNESSVEGFQASYVLASSDRQERFGPYILYRQIGAGGFGIVFLAIDTRDRRQVALKLPMPHVMLLPDSLRRFRLDARIGLLLDHPDIVKVLEFDSVGPIPYIAAEYIEGPTLEAWFDSRGGQVSHDEAVDVTIALANALAYAHGRGVVHRDIKPANVLMRPVSDAVAVIDDTRPCLTDFGLAHVNKELRASSASSSTALVGSIPYMPPEQIVGDFAEVGPPGDVYALGVILYRLLTGTMPFGGRSVEYLMHQVIHNDPPSMRSVKRNIPSELETICRKCLSKKPHRRYADAGALRDDLIRFRSGQPILARPLPIWERAIGWSRKHPAASVGGVSLVGGTGSIVVQQQARNLELNEIVNRLNRTVKDLELSKERERQSRLEVEDHLRRIEEAERHRKAVDYYKGILQASKALDQADPFLAQKIMADIPDFSSGQEFVGRYLYRRATEKVRMITEFKARREIWPVPVHGTRKWMIVIQSMRTPGPFDIAEIFETETWTKVGEVPMGPAPNFWYFAFASVDESEIAIIHYTDSKSKDDNKVIEILGTKIWRAETGETESVASPGEFDNHLYVVKYTYIPNEGHVIVTQERRYYDSNGKFVRRDEVHRFDLANRKWFWCPRSNDLGEVRVSPNGKWICEKPRDEQLCVRSIDGGEPAWLPIPEGHRIDAICFDSTESNLVATSSTTRHLFAWRLPASSGDLPYLSRPLQMKPYRIEPLKFRNRILIVEGEGDIATFEFETCRLSKFAFDPLDPAHASIMQTDSQWMLKDIPELNDLIAFGTRHEPVGNRIFLWDLRTDKQILEASSNIGHHVTLSGHDEFLYLNDAERIYEWRPRNVDPIPTELAGHADEAWCAAFTPDGSKLVTGSDDLDDAPTVKVWDWRNGRELLGWKAHDATVSVLSVNPDGKLLATGSLKDINNLKLWNLETGTLIAGYDGFESAVRRIAFSPDGRLLAAGDKKGRVIVRELQADRELFRTEFGSSYQITHLKFPEGVRELHVGIQGGVYRRLALPSGDEKGLTQFELDRQIYTTDALNLYGAGVLSSGRIFVADLRIGATLAYFEMDSMQPIAVFLFPDGKTLAAGDKLGVLMMWDLETGETKFRTQAHKAQINAITLSPDGRTLVTCAHDGSVRIWHAGDDSNEPIVF